MACFKASDVPVGSRLYLAAPSPAASSVPDGATQDADRYRWLRDRVCFSTSKGETPEMGLSSWISAPDHNPHTDWMSPRFEASVDRTIDAARAAQTKNPADAVGGKEE